MDRILIPTKTAQAFKHVVSKDSTRYHLTGLHVRRDGQRVRLEATDGHQAVRLEWEDGQTFEHETFSCLLDLGTIAAAVKRLDKTAESLAVFADCSVGAVLKGCDATWSIPRDFDESSQEFPDFEHVIKPDPDPVAESVGFGGPLMRVLKCWESLTGFKNGSEALRVTLTGAANVAEIYSNSGTIAGLTDNGTAFEFRAVVMPVRLK